MHNIIITDNDEEIKAHALRLILDARLPNSFIEYKDFKIILSRAGLINNIDRHDIPEFLSNRKNEIISVIKK